MGRKDIVKDSIPFSKDNQPSPEAKSAGHRRKKALKELAEAIVSGDALTKAEAIAKRIGIELNAEDYTIEMILTIRQVEKAIAKGDTRAYNAIMDRLKGKPRQQVDHTSNGKSIGSVDLSAWVDSEK